MWTSLGSEVGPIRFGGGRGVSRTGQILPDDAVTFGPAPSSVPCNGIFGVGIDQVGGAWASCSTTIYSNPDGAAWQTAGTYEDALLDVGPDGAIYALGSSISRSRDGAKTWQVLRLINDQAYGGSVDGGGVVRFGPKGAIIVFAMLFYTTDGGGNPIGEIFISLDGGDSFVVSTDVGVPTPTGTMSYAVGASNASAATVSTFGPSDSTKSCTPTHRDGRRYSTARPSYYPSRWSRSADHRKLP